MKSAHTALTIRLRHEEAAVLANVATRLGTSRSGALRHGLRLVAAAQGDDLDNVPRTVDKIEGRLVHPKGTRPS